MKPDRKKKKSHIVPRYTVEPCSDPAVGARILCNGCPYLRTDFQDIPAEEHTEMAREIAERLQRG